jgi:hypothetical protein
MALPSLLEKNQLQSEKESLNILKDQKELLTKLNSNIVNSQKEYGSLRKDMNDLRREFMVGIDTFSEIRKYFQDMKTVNLKEKQIETKERKGTNFFTAAIAKLIGRRGDSVGGGVQEKLLQETEIIRSLAHNTNDNIKFIKKSYEPGIVAKQRALLAREIAEEMGEGKGGGGLVSGLVAGLGVALAALGTFVVAGFGKFLTEGFSKLSSLFSKFDIPMKLGTSRGSRANLPDYLQTDKDRQQQKQGGSPSWWATGSKFLKGLTGIGLATTTSDLGDSSLEEYKRRKRLEYQQNPISLNQDLERIGTEAQFMAKTEDDPSVVAEANASQNPEAYMANYISDLNRLYQKDSELKELSIELGNIAIDAQKEYLRQMGIVDHDLLQQEEEKKELNAEEIEVKKEEVNLYDVMKEKLKDFTKDVGSLGMGDKVKEFLNTLGQVSFATPDGLVKHNLLPNFGNNVADSIELMGKELKELQEGGMGTINSIVSNATNVAGGTTTIFPDASARSSDMEEYRSRRPIQ